MLTAAALAGLRVGYGAFPLDMMTYLWRAKQPYNVSVAAETAACAALTNMPYLDTVRNALVSERDRLFKLLQAVPFLQPYPSHANFILAKVRIRARVLLMVCTAACGYAPPCVRACASRPLKARTAPPASSQSTRPLSLSDAPPARLRATATNTPQVTGGRDAKEVKDTLASKYGIMVRHYAKKELSGYVRVSVGKPEHTEALLKALHEMAAAK